MFCLEENLSPEDISKALVVMISQNITQIAFLNAKLYQLDKVIFTGSFLRHNDIAHITLAKNIKVDLFRCEAWCLIFWFRSGRMVRCLLCSWNTKDTLGHSELSYLIFNRKGKHNHRYRHSFSPTN